MICKHAAKAVSEMQEEDAKWAGRLLEIVGLEVMMEGVRLVGLHIRLLSGTHVAC